MKSSILVSVSAPPSTRCIKQGPVVFFWGGAGSIGTDVGEIGHWRRVPPADARRLSAQF